MTSGDRGVAVLGTGPLGAPMARNLAAAGFETRVWNRTRERARVPAELRVRPARKDAGVALAAASDAGARLAGLEAIAAQLDRAIDGGHGDEDLAAAV